MSPSIMETLPLSLRLPLPVLVQGQDDNLIGKQTLSCLAVRGGHLDPSATHACPNFLHALIKGRLWPPSTRRFKRSDHWRHVLILIPAQISRSLLICKTNIPDPTSSR